MTAQSKQTRQGMSCDVLVVGSGAGGLSAALTASHLGLDVIVVEKEPMFGGTTAYSAGVIWIPGNTKQPAAGIEDSVAAGLTYLREEAGNRLREPLARAYLENAPRMLDFLEQNTEMRYDLLPTVPDYHPDYKGGLKGGRSLRPTIYDGRLLGTWFSKLRPPLASMTILGGMMVGSGDLPYLYSMTRSPASFWYATKMFLRHLRDRISYPRGTRLTNGNALVARLARSALDRGIPLWLSTPVTGLTRENGRVTGAIVRKDGAEMVISAKRGVVLATGGFPANDHLRAPYDSAIAKGRFHHSLPPDGNTGDGLQLAQSVGGAFDDDVHHHVAWTPVSLVPQVDGSTVGFPHFNDRAKPGFIVVDRNGRRFANDSSSYHDFVPAWIEACRERGDFEAFIIGDHVAVRRFGVGAVPPSPMPIGPHLHSGYLAKGKTIEELATRLGIDAAGLAATVSDWNTRARDDADPAFGRGADAFQQYHGAAHARGKHPNIAPVEQAPFYGVRIRPGDIGTFAGLRTDEHARVLDDSGAVIAGLYAAGNDMASVMRGTYPGAGITIGPALTFGYIAARDLAGVERSGKPERAAAG